jgi:hypothetical protein
MSYVRIESVWGLYEVQIDTLNDDHASVAAATITDGLEQHTVTASAKRDRGDPRNTPVGEQLAVGRALEKLGKELQAAAWSRTSK